MEKVFKDKSMARHIAEIGRTAEALFERYRIYALLGAEVDMVYYVYVLDQDERLHGVLSLKRLLLARGYAPVAEIMSRNPKTVQVDSSLEDVLELVAQYKLTAVPVLEDDGRMAGIVSADDIMEHFLPFALRWKQYKALRNF